MLSIEEGLNRYYEREERGELEDKGADRSPSCGEGFGRPERRRDSGDSLED